MLFATMNLFPRTLALLSFSTALQAQSPQPAPQPTTPLPVATPDAPDLPAIKPNPFLVAHESFLKIANEGKAELLFLGDSLVTPSHRGGAEPRTSGPNRSEPTPPQTSE